MMIEIKLVDHIGESPSGERVDHDQWIVSADDVQIGYLPKAPGAWLQCIVSMDEGTKAEVIEAINKRVVHDIGGAVTPPEPIEDEDEE
jgi:hypothetical protein